MYFPSQNVLSSLIPLSLEMELYGPLHGACLMNFCPCTKDVISNNLVLWHILFPFCLINDAGVLTHMLSTETLVIVDNIIRADLYLFKSNIIFRE